MPNWFPLNKGGLRGKGRGAPASADYDARFLEASVRLSGGYFCVDWHHGGRLELGLGLCDQLLLGAGSEAPPRKLTLRFRTQYPAAEASEADTGMLLVRIMLRGPDDLGKAWGLYQELIDRCPWLLSGRSRGAESVTGSEPAPLPGHGAPDRRPQERPTHPPRADTPAQGRPVLGPEQPTHDLERSAHGPDQRASGTNTQRRASAPAPAPPAAENPGEWLSITPGLRTRELYEDLFRRRAQAERR